MHPNEVVLTFKAPSGAFGDTAARQYLARRVPQ